MFHCQAVVVVCGQPGMFMVVAVMIGQHGGRPLLRWWLWDEEGSHVTACDMCDFWINIPMLMAKFEVYAVLQCLLYNL